MKEWSAFQFEEIKKNPAPEGEKWTIYSRKVRENMFSEYKIEGVVDASPKACMAAFRQDILNQSTDVKNKKYPVYEIISETNDSILTYVIHHEPFPLKDTEMSVLYIFSKNEDGSIGVTWHEAWHVSLIQPSKKLKRVETFRGSWSFDTTAVRTCQAVNSVQFDSKGMPIWLVKPMVIKFLKTGLEGIREEAPEVQEK